MSIQPESRFYVTPFNTPPSQPDARPSQRRYHYLDYKPPGGVEQKAAVLVLHGFPDFSSSWRNIVSPLTLAGFRLIIPDLLGYGLSSSPPTSKAGAKSSGGGEPRLAEYGGKAICTDLDGLLDHAKAGQGALYGSQTVDKEGRGGRVIVLGHDWGSWLSWKVGQWLQHRVMGIAGLCVPFAPPTPEPVSIDQLIKFLPNFGYQKFFAEERSTKIIEDNLERFLRLVYTKPGLFSGPDQPTKGELEKARGWNLEGRLEKLLTDPELSKLDISKVGSCILDERELQRYVSVFRSRGMEGPLSWYRTRMINFQEDRDLKESGLPASLPALLLTPSEDVAVPASMSVNMPRRVPSVNIVPVQGSGHFVQNEMPNVVSTEFQRWVEDKVFPSERNASPFSFKGWLTRSKL
ncbi:alpha/beta-hydrolase [Violaceomyces palustris]|uniref:Alpha/beta-hydrolase n=1 Tax=Violaceomyces palustris TaxID=1673888 RepID=A0ACD0NRL0_9BASI|nr:alpha/beta-hydrolase [Violaceomyces palustris]